MTSGVAHSHNRLVGLGGKRKKPERPVGYFLNSEESAFNQYNDAPKTKGQRFSMELNPDGSIK